MIDTATAPSERTLAWLRQFALIALALMAVYIRYSLLHKFGPWLTPDTANYFAAATNLVAGKGLLIFDGAQLTQYAPFYSILLAGMQFAFGLKPFAATQFLNPLFFGLVVYLGGVLFFRHLKSPLLAFVGTLSLLASRPLFEDTLMAMSEMTFLVLALLFLVLFEFYQKTPRIWKLVLAGLVVSLAALTRYVGVILIPIGILDIWFLTQAPRRERLRAVIVFAVSSLVFSGVWMVRNFLLTGLPFGGRGVPQATLAEAVQSLFKVIVGWYVPGASTAPLTALLILGAIAVGLLAFAARDNWRTAPASFRKHGDLIVFCVLYTAIVLYQVATTTLNLPDNRLMSPLVVPLGILILVFLETMVHKLLPARQFLVATVVLSVGIVAWLPLPQSNVRELANMYISHQGIGWNNSYWNVSPTIAYLRNNPLDCEYFYSNGPDILWLQAEIPSTMLTKTMVAPGFRKANSICVVWFEGFERGYALKIEELRKSAQVVPIAELKGGAIYSASFKTP